MERNCDENISLRLEPLPQESKINAEDPVTSHLPNMSFHLKNEDALSVSCTEDTNASRGEITEQSSAYSLFRLNKAEDVNDTTTSCFDQRIVNDITSPLQKIEKDERILIMPQPKEQEQNKQDETFHCVAATDQSVKSCDALPLEEHPITFPCSEDGNSDVQILTSDSDTAASTLGSATDLKVENDNQLNFCDNSERNSLENGHGSELVVKVEIVETDAFSHDENMLSASSWMKSGKDVNEGRENQIRQADSQSYRNVTCISLVNYSDSERSSSSESCVSDDELEEEDDTDVDSETCEQTDDRKSEVSSDGSQQTARLRSNGEVFPEELPPLDYLTISAPEEVELVQLGTVSGIVDVLVVIKALEATPALYDDSVLFLENRQPLGMIFETFGTVERTFYSVRFNSADDIQATGVNIGDKILYAPKADNLTKFIFISELRKMRADDASWEFDNEAPEGVRDFSDDEEERRAKGKGKSSSRHKRKRPGAGNQHGTERNPRLLKGDLNRNPFGNRHQKFGRNSKSEWPQGQTSQSETKTFCCESSNPPHPTTATPPFAGFQNDGIIAQRVATFGHKPAWMNRPGFMGSTAPPPRSFLGNSMSLPSFGPCSNVPPQQGGRLPMNPSIESVHNQRFWPPPDFTRPAPFGMPVRGPPNRQIRPFGHPTFPPPPFPFLGNAKALPRP